MAVQIEWTEQSLADMQLIIDYLREEWSYRVAEIFIKTTSEKLKIISELPSVGMITSKTAVRSIFLSPHNRLYYRIGKDKLVILTIFNNKQDPNKNPYR